MKIWLALAVFFATAEAQEPEGNCPTPSFFLPMNDFARILAMEEINSHPSNPAARVFPMASVFHMDKLTHNSAKVLCLNARSEGSGPPREATPKPIVSILGALGGTLGPTVGRSVTGDPTIILGYSSKTAVDPEEVQAEIEEHTLGNVRLLDQSLSYSMNLDLLTHVTPSARERFGQLVSVTFGRNLVISEFRFRNIIFKREAHSQSFVGHDAAGDELRIIIPSYCSAAGFPSS